MTHTLRILLFALAALALAAGCGVKPGPVDGGPPDAGGVCFEDTDCPDPQLFFCNTTTSACEPACRVKTDCEAATRGQYALDYCASGLGCQCDEGKCVGSLCSADVDCGTTQVCRSGACVAAPAASTVDSCTVIPDYAVIKQGEKAKFWVSAWDATKNPVVVKDGFAWSNVGAAVAVSGPANGSSAEFTGGTPNVAAEAAVKVTIGTKDCFAKVLVLSSTVPADTVTAVVTDELTGRPITGATVLASSTADGSAIGVPALTVAGQASLPVVAATNATVTVSVFHTDYNYLTIANYPMTGTRMLSFVLRRNQVDKFGGYKGTLSNPPATSNVHVGLAGMSIAGSITDLSVAQLLGPSQATDIKIGTAIDQKGVKIPAGVYLGFTDQVIKGNIAGQGLAGTCLTAGGLSDDALINAGTCGTRTAWALTGDIPLGDLPIDAFAGGTAGLDVGKLLSRIIPIFKKFNSSLKRDVQFTLKQTPRDGGEYDFTDNSSFTVSNLDFSPPAAGGAATSAVPLAFNFATRVPDLPSFRSTPVDGVVLLGGAIVQGRGVVPLGLGIGVNTAPVDLKTDTQAELPAPGLVSLRMAPTHHGIEGSPYGIVALGLSLKSISDASAGLATSAIFQRVPVNALKFDPKGASPIDLAAFPGFPEGAKYNYTDTAQGAIGPRKFIFASQAGSGATGSSVVRIVWTDDAAHSWVAYLDPTQGGTGFVMPKPPGTFADRTFDLGIPTSLRSGMLVQQLRLNTNPSAVPAAAALDFKGLVEHNGTNGDRVVDFTTGFALQDYARPEIAWKTPSAPNAMVAKGSTVVATVTAFKVGATASDDGFVRLSFTGGVGCTNVDQNTDSSMGKGDISMVVPVGCTGATAMTATLMNGATMAPIDPPVSAVITVQIQ